MQATEEVNAEKSKAWAPVKAKEQSQQVEQLPGM